MRRKKVFAVESGFYSETVNDGAIGIAPTYGEKYPAIFSDAIHAHIALRGNSKCDLPTFNLLAGDEPYIRSDGLVFTTLRGTCTGCCTHCQKKCYARNYTMRFQNTCLQNYIDNTLLVRFDREKLFRELQDYLDNTFISVFHFHSSGEIDSEDYLKDIIKLAKNNPRIQFYLYTKRYEWLENNADDIPFNLITLVSIWHNNYDNPLNFPEFIYDDGTDPEVAKLPHCPAVDKNGRRTGMTCSKCRRCVFAKPGMKTAVYEH